MILSTLRLTLPAARRLATFLAVFAVTVSAHGIHMTFVLDQSTATLSNINPQSDFYKLDEPSRESGTGAGIFDFLFGVDNQLGEFVQLTWAGNPKPFLTGVGLKAGSAKSTAGGMFAMLWGADDLQLFNESSSYDAIRIYQDGIVHKKKWNKYLGISHITVDGEPGRADVKVPDSGSALAMLGAGLAVLFVLRRSMKAAG